MINEPTEFFAYYTGFYLTGSKEPMEIEGSKGHNLVEHLINEELKDTDYEVEFNDTFIVYSKEPIEDGQGLENDLARHSNYFEAVMVSNL